MKKQSLPYLSYNRYMQKLFKKRVYKVSVDGGFSCPNRDGAKSFSGCIFCDAKGASSRTHAEFTPIKEQVLKNIQIRKSRYKAEKFIVYLQSFTNTYASLKTLKKRYDEALFAHKDIVGLSISTRPDCIDEEKIKLIASYKDKVPYVCVEYGLQTIHDKTLKRINRQESFADFLKALELSKKYGLHNCAHVILNLPGEGRKEMLETADKLAELQVEGVKIHLLAVLKNTFLHRLFLAGKWQSPSLQESVQRACDFIEHLPADTIIHRVSSRNGHPHDLVHPLWMRDGKEKFANFILQEFKTRGTYQGFF